MRRFKTANGSEAITTNDGLGPVPDKSGHRRRRVVITTSMLDADRKLKKGAGDGSAR